MSTQIDPDIVSKQPQKKRRPSPTRLGKIFRALRNELDMNMGDMAAKLGYSKSYLSQVEVGKIPPSLGLLEKYIAVFKLDASKSYSLFITAYENLDEITIDMSKLRTLNREEFSRLLAIIKFFDPKVDKQEIEAHKLRDAINAIWKRSMP